MLEQIAVQAVPDDLDVWPSLRARLSARRAPARPAQWRWPAMAAAAALVALLFVALTPGWIGTDAVSAETILDRAASTAAGSLTVRTYHLLMTGQSPAKGVETSTTEVWFDGPDRQRSTERVVGASGTTDLTQDVIFNGPETWIVSTDKGQSRTIHTIGTHWNKPADDPSAQGSLADLLNRYGDKQCVAARLQSGEGTVAGQPTYVIDVAPKPAACGPRPEVSPVPQQAARVSGQVTSSRLENMSQPLVRVWVDKHSFLPLKTEVRDPSGAVLERSEVTRVDYNVSVPDATFTYTPPAGMQISTFNGGDGADVKRALYSAQEGKPLPAKP